MNSDTLTPADVVGAMLYMRDGVNALASREVPLQRMSRTLSNGFVRQGSAASSATGLMVQGGLMPVGNDIATMATQAGGW